MTFSFDHNFPLRPIELYQTAIQMMYDLAQQDYTEVIHMEDSKELGNYNVLILFVNTQVSTAPDQLRVMHCVAALYRAILVMTDGLMFCQMRSQLAIGLTDIGGLSIMALDDAAIAGTNTTNTDLINDTDVTSKSPSNRILGPSRGQIKDPENPSFVINFHFFGKPITSKEVSLAVLEGLAAAAPHPKTMGCKELEVVSPTGGCAIFVGGVASHHAFTYQWATRALKLLYQQIVVPQKNFGDLYLDLRFDGQTFGELRMLRIVDEKNSSDVVTNER
ncbi:MAG: hypothetical protein Q9225_007441 [Loekoesia sp. 1 TL-2023]